MIEHKIMISFNASRPLSFDEMSDLERAVAAQVEEPVITNEQGDLEDASFEVSGVVVNFLIPGVDALADEQ
jgi:hypothetical protein